MKSISFNDEMVRAILEGRKSQMRRPVKGLQGYTHISGSQDSERSWKFFSEDGSYAKIDCPYGKVGGLLSVRGTTINLEITNIRVERVQEISPEDAIREGAREFLDLPPSSPYGQDDRWSMGSPTRTGQCLGSPIMAFANAWNSIYEKKGFGWHVNPWAWVIEFKIKDKS